MGRRFKSEKDIRTIAQELRSARSLRALTLEQVAARTGVDCGQLSRFENGKFQTESSNLQKVMAFLQIAEVNLSSTNLESTQQLSTRVEQFASRSRLHREILEEILSALERLA